MPLELSKVHDYRKVRLKDGSYAIRMISKNLLARFKEGENPPLFAQGGHVYPEGQGAPALPREEYPGWLEQGIMRMSDKGREGIGFPVGCLPCEMPPPEEKVEIEQPTSSRRRKRAERDDRSGNTESSN